MTDRTVFSTNSSACLNSRASDLRVPPPVEVILVGQISLPSGSLLAVRELICLLLGSQIECVHRGCVNGQKCGGAGRWRAGPPKRNFFQRLPGRTLFITAVMSGVVLLGPGWKLRCLCVIYKLHMCVFSLETTLELWKCSSLLLWLTSAPKISFQLLV